MTRMKRPLMIWGIIEIGNCLSLAVLVNRSVPRAIIMREFLAVAALALSASMAVAQKTAPGDRVTVLHSEAQLRFPRILCDIKESRGNEGDLEKNRGAVTDAAHNLDRNGRERDSLLASRLPSRVLLEIGHGKERAAGVDPAPCFDDRTWTSARQIELAIPVKCVGLEQTSVFGQMALRMLAFAVAGVIEHCRRRRCPTEWRVIADIDPASADK